MGWGGAQSEAAAGTTRRATLQLRQPESLARPGVFLRGRRGLRGCPSGEGNTGQHPHPLWPSPQATGSDTSLEVSRSSSAGSLQTTLEDSLTLSDSPRRGLGLPASVPGPRAGPSPAARRRPSPRGRGTFSLRGLRAHQRSHSSGGSTSPGCTRHDSMDPSDEEGAGGRAGGGCGGAGSEHSETLSSLSLTSLFGPPPPPPGLPPARRFSSASSLAAGPGRPRAAAAPGPRGLARSPSWAAADRCKDPPRPAEPAAPRDPEAPEPQPPPPPPGEPPSGDAASQGRR